ncbi:MAG: Fic family protein [Alphaproteobacteria bacterium]|nr:Fic family protein [Alphaproteobacteria bacterium]
MPISGSKVNSGRGYDTFQPNALQQIEKELDLSNLYQAISSATWALGQLNALNILLPNPELLIEKYALKEALLSSQIEGTQSTMVEILQNENNNNDDIKVDIIEVKNYLHALNYATNQIKNGGLPLSSRLLRECHNILMNNVRGGENDKTPGEFRRSQNFIGGNNPSTAIYVPPKEDTVINLMSDLEKYIYEGTLPDVIKLALIHYQFETIHPFLDGNGRIGRLLISLFLISKNILEQPTLYLSLYLKKHKQEYYTLLTKTRENNDFETWILFFLKGIEIVCKQIMQTTTQINSLKNELSHTLKGENEYKLFDFLFVKPTLEISAVEKSLQVSKATANKLVNGFVEKGLLVQTNQTKRYKKYIFKKYMDIIEAGL